MSYIKEWDEHYDNPDILDGTSWSIVINYGNINVNGVEIMHTLHHGVDL